MAIKKSDLYSSLWASCDELRGGMDASQYKDYVLFMLFIKYISDKYGDSDDFAPPVVIRKGASFKDMVALKDKDDIGDKINTQVIQPLIDANSRLARSDFPDFNDSSKLGDGAQKVEKLGNLVASCVGAAPGEGPRPQAGHDAGTPLREDAAGMKPRRSNPCMDATPAGVVSVASGFRGYRSFLARPPANGWHPSGMTRADQAKEVFATSPVAMMSAPQAGDLAALSR